MPNTIDHKVRKWDLEDYPMGELVDPEKAPNHVLDNILDERDGDYPSRFRRIERQIDYLADKLYSEYQVTMGTSEPPFEYRLRDWLDSAKNDDDQKTMFELIPRLFFIGSNEFNSLCKSVFDGPIARWLIDQLKIPIHVEDAQDKLIEGLKSTWFGSITDSAVISDFHHINKLAQNIRPNWQTLLKLGNQEGTWTFMGKHDPPLERIVLIEDFVGTGSQIEKTVQFVAELRKDRPYPVLLCPLVIGQSGNDKALALSRKYPHLTYSPVLCLDETVLLPTKPGLNENAFITRLRDVVLRTYPLVKGSQQGLYGPFGFGEKQQGGGLLVVQYTNCPNNTIPLIHHQSDGPWKPLFPRSSRT